MLYHCDATLPEIERYASPRFRRIAQWFRPKRLDHADVLELVAFVESIGGVKFGAYVFHWGQAGVRAYARLARRVLVEAQPYIRANEASFGVDDGLAVLRAMQDGGWTGHGLPSVVKMTIQTLLLDNTQAEVARSLRLTAEQVAWASGRKGQARKRARANASGALAIG